MNIHAYWLVVTALFGGIVGSFLNVCIYRLPIGESVVRPRSHCPGCGAFILWYDNIPVISWLILLGRCRRCQNRISLEYPLIELAAALATVITCQHFGLVWSSLPLVLLGYAFLVLTMIDFHHYILPDLITLPGIGFGLLLSSLPWLGLPSLSPPLAAPTSAWIGVLCGGGGLWLFAWLFERLTGKVGMGYGDVKLFAMIGAWMGWQALPYTLFLAAALGAVVGILWILLFRRDRTLPIPFGPYLVVAAWSYLFFGTQVYAWYFGLMVRGY